jgi:D-sedoheptulose 7-phosphate isomerase
LTEQIINEITESIKVKTELIEQAPLILDIATDIVESIQKGGKVIFCGNGGSAADSQHIVAEFIGKFMMKRKSLPAISLTTNTSIITSIGNDFDFSEIFSRQVEALTNEKDIVIGISTSGNSSNVIRALEEAHKLKALTIALTGKDGGKLSKIAKKTIKVPSNNTQRIQECHILIGHLLALIVENKIMEI